MLIILLSEAEPQSLEQVVRELADSRAEICDAVHNLRDAGLVIVDGDRLSASRAARTMDRLGV